MDSWELPLPHRRLRVVSASDWIWVFVGHPLEKVSLGRGFEEATRLPRSPPLVLAAAPYRYHFEHALVRALEEELPLCWRVARLRPQDWIG